MLFFKYGSAKIFEFDIKNHLKDYGKQMTTTDIKNLPSKQLCIICADVDNKGFDIYSHGIYSRMFRALLNGNLSITVKRIESKNFKKLEYPGVNPSDEANIRKAINDYLVLSTLVRKDTELFLTVYWRKVSDFLDALVNVKTSYETIVKHVDMAFDKEILKIFDNKASAMRLMNEYDKITKNAKRVQIIQHMEEFLKLS